MVVGRDEKKRIREIIKRLRKAYPEATCALVHANPLQLLIATILSAQCTDERVNIVTATLFRKYGTARDLASLSQEELENEIRSTGFFRNKAKSIRGACRKIMDDFGGEVPQTMEELLTLPGVARKTANVVLGTAFGIPSGVVVDTHVTRISTLLGLTKEKTAEKIELELQRLAPKKDWIDFSHLLIHHGRRVCIARRPKCVACPIEALCPSSQLRQNEIPLNAPGK